MSAPSDPAEPPLFFVYLDRVEILDIHLAVLNPGEVTGVLHPDQVDAAVARPQRAAFGADLFPTVWDKAACLLHSIAGSGIPSPMATTAPQPAPPSSSCG